MKDFRQLEVWQRSHRLVLSIYGTTRTFPKDEQYGITGQLRRCIVSIPANLAEGCGRDTDAELKRFIDIAHGSASEAEYFLLLSFDLGYLDRASYSPLADETAQIKRMLGAFSCKLKADR